MSTMNPRREASAPPPLDEGYWASLLNEGEFAETVPGPSDLDYMTPPVASESQGVQVAGGMSVSSNNGHFLPTEADWREIELIMRADDVIDLPVIGFNRGGLLVEWRSLHGFVPASQLTDFPAHAAGSARNQALMALVGQSLRLRVIELNPQLNRLILSERAARVQAGERASIIQKLSTGDTVSGTVTNLCDFGAFVDLGGLEGLIHISELSWGRVGHPADILQRGQSVKAYVLDIDREAGRIALSLKRLHPDPWQTVNTRYTIGQTVEGVITNVVDFGAFACIEEGLEGLIHVSELAEGHFLHPRNVVNEGQRVVARVLSIDSQARRLGLSLRLNQ